MPIGVSSVGLVVVLEGWVSSPGEEEGGERRRETDDDTEGELLRLLLP